jgi:hypothetical protein
LMMMMIMIMIITHLGSYPAISWNLLEYLIKTLSSTRSVTTLTAFRTARNTS